ncbi:MAG: hypothetical protein A2Y59_06350 [Chloroflexi bacterium RBG_13_52_14]|nr:MAG: hypothetical protein A2Y59_06350 [Chloroflexi bacterium RBG_13_52_14]
MVTIYEVMTKLQMEFAREKPESCANCCSFTADGCVDPDGNPPHGVWLCCSFKKRWSRATLERLTKGGLTCKEKRPSLAHQQYPKRYSTSAMPVIG